ncbi:MAG: SBBP repeat-containing protein, partial [Armatimonadetes bacterium]|nr:SBBP repeat-containing protein [Armatimonadota bacterium]
IKYNLLGSRVWTRRFDGAGHGDDVPSAITVDGAGNVLVVGYTTGVTGLRQMVTIKYDTGGNTLWTRVFNGSGSGNSAATAVRTDALGRVYVTGISDFTTPSGSSSSSKVALVKYQSNGIQAWSQLYGGASTGVNTGRDLAIDSGGNVYATSSLGMQGGATAIGIEVYNSTGQLEDAVHYSDSSHAETATHSLLVGNRLLVLGSSPLSSALLSYGVTFNSTTKALQLQLQWIRHSSSRLTSIGVDGNGNTCATGSIATTSHGTDISTIQWDASGNQMWNAHWDGANHLNDAGSALAVEVDGAVFVCGYSVVNSGGSSSVVTLQYNPSGKLVSRSIFGAGLSQNTVGCALFHNSRLYEVGSISFGLASDPDALLIADNVP